MIEALTFDILGTLMDWRGSILKEGEYISERYGVQPWGEIATQWAQKCQDRTYKGPWEPLDGILRVAGEEFLVEYDIQLNHEDEGRFIRLWEYLTPWGDSVHGLNALNQTYWVVSLSNANTEMVRTLSYPWGLRWGYIVQNEYVKAFKPSPEVYAHALGELMLAPEEVMMVSAHLFDLEAAKQERFKTAFIRRPGEETGDPEKALYVDVVADNLFDFAEKLKAFRF